LCIIAIKIDAGSESKSKHETSDLLDGEAGPSQKRPRIAASTDVTVGAGPSDQKLQRQKQMKLGHIAPGADGLPAAHRDDATEIPNRN
jgi:hypothetical protein